jgi:hypothetical protein
MKTVSELIEQLHSPRDDKRYDACEALRVTDSLPKEALSALEQTTRDSDRDVADAAKRALQAHTGADGSIPPASAAAKPAVFSEVGCTAFLVGSAVAIASFILAYGVVAAAMHPSGGIEGLGLLVVPFWGSICSLVIGGIGSAVALAFNKRRPHGTAAIIGFIAGLVIGIGSVLALVHIYQ